MNYEIKQIIFYGKKKWIVEDQLGKIYCAYSRKDLAKKILEQLTNPARLPNEPILAANTYTIQQIKQKEDDCHCQAVNCKNPIYSQKSKLCSSHLTRLSRLQKKEPDKNRQELLSLVIKQEIQPRKSNIGKTCSIEGCLKQSVAKGLCKNHYNQKLGGYNPRKPRGICSIKNCNKPHYSKGLCRSHYSKKWYKELKEEDKEKNNQCRALNCTRLICNEKYELCAAHYQRLRKLWEKEPNKDNQELLEIVIKEEISRTRRPNINKTCSVEGCTKPHNAKGLCRTHYAQMKRNIKPRQKRGICSVPGCNEPHTAQGLCVKHYYRKRYQEKKAIK